MNNTICARCGKETKKLFMVQAFEYCGRQGKRKDLCTDCWRSFIEWYNQEGVDDDQF